MRSTGRKYFAAMAIVCVDSQSQATLIVYAFCKGKWITNQNG